MSEAWDFYFAKVNDVLASLFVDLGIRDAVPDDHRPWLLWVWLWLQQPRDDGLSSNEEAPLLYEIEDALSAAVGRVADAQLVGRITTAGRREFYYYGKTAEGFDESVARAIAGFPGYEFDCGTQEDPAWSQYLDVLYPSPAARERIQNRHVIESLQERGDTLTAPRPVSHWIYFTSVENQSKFAAETSKHGFRIINEISNAEDRDRPYGLVIERVDRVDWDSINEVTLSLSHLAEEFGGDYDGWETQVMSE